MYRTAVMNAKASGESSKARRYERGLKVSHCNLTVPIKKIANKKGSYDNSLIFDLDTTNYAGNCTQRRED